MWTLYFDPKEGEEDYILIDFTSGVSGKCYGWCSDPTRILKYPWTSNDEVTQEDMSERLVIVHQTETLAEMKLLILLEE